MTELLLLLLVVVVDGSSPLPFDSSYRRGVVE
jgi:hypothetical protein